MGIYFTATIKMYAHLTICIFVSFCFVCREGQKNSHAGHRWETFTDQVIRIINQCCSNVVFILLGNPAKLKQGLIDLNRHCVIKATHPSPQAQVYGDFFKKRIFWEANEALTKRFQGHPIKW